MTGAQHIRELLAIYDQANALEIKQASASYRRYNLLLSQVGCETQNTIATAAGVFAALSPNNNYISNLKDARRLMIAARAGQPIDSFKVTTYNPNKRKAWRIVQGANPLDEIRALKTRNFFLNISDPNNTDAVTIDGHIYWCYMGRRGIVKTRGKNRKTDAPPSLTPVLYNEIADAVKFVAQLRNVIPCQAQAVLWQTYRRIHHIQGAQQSELIARDAFAAGALHLALAYDGGCGQ